MIKNLPKKLDTTYFRYLSSNFLTLIASIIIFIQILINIIKDSDLIGTISFFVFFALGLFGSFASSLFLFVLPLIPDLDQQLSIFHSGISITNEYLAFKGIAGLFIATAAQAFFKSQPINRFCLPWQIALCLSVISLSTALSISHNLWQTGNTFSFYGALFNALTFPSNSWHDTYHPVIDWLAYCTAGAFIVVLLYHLKSHPNPDRFIFKPLMLGLCISACWGIFQALTGLGLDPGKTGGGRVGIDSGVDGFSADIHAYAGLMLLGALGLWGYLETVKDTRHRFAIYTLIALCWIALWLSKSRASILIALCVVCVCLIYWIIKHKNNIRLMLGISFVLTGSFISLYFLWHDLWLSNLVTLISSLNAIDNDTLNLLLAHRPEFFRAALNMFTEFPLLGVGLGNVYRLSVDASLTGSTYLAQIGGENTHNYFLQTLAELGLVGTGFLAFALFAPLRLISKRSLVWPAYCAFGSLCLGNIFAHSFLVRETLMIAAALIALAYAQASRLPASKKAAATKSKSTYLNVGIGILFLCVIAPSIIETYRSFYRRPFLYGGLCFIDRPLTTDNWTSGLFSITLPTNKSGVRLYLADTQPDALIRPLGGSLVITDSTGQQIVKRDTVWTNAGSAVIEVQLNPDQISSAQILKNQLHAQLKLSRCFVPRNLGINTDNRLLGVRIDRIEFIDDK